MFDFQYWIDIFVDHNQTWNEIYNDAASYGVIIKHDSKLNWKVLGVHHLGPSENQGNHNVYVEVLCANNPPAREGFRAIHWTWEGRHPSEAAPDIFASQKPLNELVNLPLNLGMVVSVWPHQGETVYNLSSDHPDEDEGNSIGHHSFFVCFQEADEGKLPPPKPEAGNASIQVIANLDWLNTLPVDNEGNITFIVYGENNE